MWGLVFECSLRVTASHYFVISNVTFYICIVCLSFGEFGQIAVKIRCAFAGTVRTTCGSWVCVCWISTNSLQTKSFGPESRTRFLPWGWQAQGGGENRQRSSSLHHWNDRVIFPNFSFYRLSLQSPAINYEILTGYGLEAQCAWVGCVGTYVSWL